MSLDALNSVRCGLGPQLRLSVHEPLKSGRRAVESYLRLFARECQAFYQYRVGVLRSLCFCRDADRLASAHQQLEHVMRPVRPGHKKVWINQFKRGHTASTSILHSISSNVRCSRPCRDQYR